MICAYSTNPGYQFHPSVTQTISLSPLILNDLMLISEEYVSELMSDREYG